MLRLFYATVLLAVLGAPLARAALIWSEDFEAAIIDPSEGRVSINGYAGWVTTSELYYVYSDSIFGSGQALGFMPDVFDKLSNLSFLVDPVDGAEFQLSFDGSISVDSSTQALELGLIGLDDSENVLLTFKNGGFRLPGETSDRQFFGTEIFHIAISFKEVDSVAGTQKRTFTLTSPYAAPLTVDQAGMPNFAFKGLYFKGLSGTDDGINNFDNFRLEGTGLPGQGVVPEPMTMAVGGAGLALAMLRRRRR